MNKKRSAVYTKGEDPSCWTRRGMFRFCAEWISLAVGSPWAFALAMLVILIWLLTGPLCHYSDTWQLVINTATTIITFLMVFLIQNTHTKAIHLKFDELLRGVGGARNSLVSLERPSDGELDQLQREFGQLRTQTPKDKSKLAHE